MTSLPISASPAARSSGTPVSVQALGMLLFAGFAIPVTIIAMVQFWPAGVLLAIILGWRGAATFGGQRSFDPAATVTELMPDKAPLKRSGNASFDRYRDDMLSRLETEQENFEAFLDRLRASKDQAQFDTYLDERAENSRKLAHN